MRRWALALAAAVLGGCGFQSYTPPARLLPLENARAPEVGRTDLQAEASAATGFFDFGATAGGLRVRHGVGDEVSLEAEAATMHVSGTTSPGVDQDAYVGRVGADFHPAPDDDAWGNVAARVGVGAGHSGLAGDWISYDLGTTISSRGRTHDVFFGAEAFGSTPIRPRPFRYRAPDDAPAGGDTLTSHLDVLSQTFGGRFTLGVDVHAADEALACTFGAFVGVIGDGNSKTDAFGGLGAAVRWKLP